MCIGTHLVKLNCHTIILYVFNYFIPKVTRSYSVPTNLFYNYLWKIVKINYIKLYVLTESICITHFNLLF